MGTSHRYDVVVIGGGHNGLVTAGLLAKRGLKTVVLEKRHKVGGAAVTEQPWGPDYKMTALSYVVSLMPPTVLRELELERHGYKIYPQHPYFVPYPDGRYLIMADDPKRKHAEISKFSKKDADAMVAWDAWLASLAKVLGPLLTTVPPKIGSRTLGDLMAAAGLAWRFRELSVQQVGDITKLMGSSVADLLEETFESPQVKGVLSVSGVIGAWAGPRSPGTAYVMVHHKLGDVGHGQMGSWGFPEGGMGGVTQAMASAAKAQGATIVTDAAVAKILVRGGRACGVALANGDEYEADTVVATCHPKLTFLDFVDRKELPPEFVKTIEGWKSRSGTVKVNVAVDKLPDFECKPGFDPEVHGGTIVLAQNLEDIEGAFQDAVAGHAAHRPFADICIPSVFDKTLAPEGKHVISMFTQWVPHTWSKEPNREELEKYADRVIERVDELAHGFKSSILHRQVIGPYEMEQEYGLVGGNIFHGELSIAQLFHMRPAPGYADYRTPIRGLYHASSATHGGGGVTGIPALQVVEQIRAER
ncbi:MAG: NAD(P)/FAD-dependent oxidoreductase [Deltaproteobacteria bacterium]|nr:NAD(P)/FAD-dependent oxidoreductase [Deltaproteobacteria bacterium]